MHPRRSFAPGLAAFLADDVRCAGPVVADAAVPREPVRDLDEERAVVGEIGADQLLGAVGDAEIARAHVQVDVHKLAGIEIDIRGRS